MRYTFILIFSLVASSLFGQILEPVKWSFSKEKISDTEYNLVFTAKMEKGWSVYSQHTGEDGPVPTAISFDDISGATLGKNDETGHKKEGFDKLFETNVIKFLSDKPYVITQKVTITDASKPIVGYLTYMTCNDKTCLPPTDIDFTFNFPAEATKKVVEKHTSAAKKEVKNREPKLSVTTQPTIEKITVTTPSNINISLPEEQKQEATETTNSFNVSFNDKATEKKMPTDTNGGMLEPVKWTFNQKKISDDILELTFEADIEKGWSVYSQHTGEDGPVPTAINYDALDGATLGENTEKGHKKEGFDKLFKTNVIKFLDDEKFIITQQLNLSEHTKNITGYLTYMACNSQTCLPPTDVDFTFNLNGDTNESATAPIANLTEEKLDQKRPSLIRTHKEPLSECGKNDIHENKKSLIWLLLAGFLGGFAALLTPCVFPMIPITVSFFTKDTKRKGWMNGLIYGLSIMVIYVTLGLMITIFFGAEALNALATNWIANTIFFIIFIVFAFSFFGFYELTLPSSWTTKTDRMADKGGLLGIFFMAATLSLVSFSCTGPIVGSALVAAANGGLMGPLSVMLGFSLALALPFGLFAAFPAWLNSLPRSGGWMNSVKVVLGFLEVGFAFKFLSTADLTQHWGILKYEVFMVIMILVAIAIALYLFGFIKFPHDSPIKKLSITRKLIATGFGLLAIYLATGFTLNKDTEIYKSLWLTSGFSPPVNYNLMLKKPAVDPEIKAQYPSYTLCANNISCFKNYYEGVAYAKSVNKPALLDFTGHGCQNCRRTEDNIWVYEKVRSTLNDSLVLISLYVDDSKKLDIPFVSANDGKKKRTVGAQWADFQVTNFHQNSQPLYIMIDNEEQVITYPRGYEEGVNSYYDYLQCGLNSYKTL